MSRPPRLIATWGWRWEPEWLVDGLRENLSWVDGHAVIDDRDRRGPWGHEGEYRARQMASCRASGADWVLVTSPDERLEDQAERIIRETIAATPRGARVVYDLELREMWTPTAFRSDGDWGIRRRSRLFPIYPDSQFLSKRIHSKPYPIGAHHLNSGARIYHLKHIEPANRRKRMEVFKEIDSTDGRPSRLPMWESYMDESGLQLTEIPEGRGFRPAYDRPYIWEPTP